MAVTAEDHHSVLGNPLCSRVRCLSETVRIRGIRFATDRPVAKSFDTLLAVTINVTELVTSLGLKGRDPYQNILDALTTLLYADCVIPIGDAREPVYVVTSFQESKDRRTITVGILPGVVARVNELMQQS